MENTSLVQVIARILIVGLFLQGCQGFGNLPLSGIEEQNQQPDTQAILDKEFVAEGGHLVTFYNEKDEIKANLQVNPLDEKDKCYNGLPVVIEKGVELASLVKMSQNIQQKRIQVQFFEKQKGKPKSVLVHKPWLMGGEKEVIALYGNPGVGKSTLCNSIFQKAVFKSELSIIGVTTTAKQEYTYNNKLYIDTPGLDDVIRRQQAAREIEEALKCNKNYRVVFVAMLDQGRIRPADLVTINTVCDAISIPFEYGLVFNKVTRGISDQIARTDLSLYLTHLNKKPCVTVIINKDSKIDDEENAYLGPDNPSRGRLMQFLENLSTTAPEIKESIIFCGNPGVGKSTLCNSIFQKDVFESGISLEGGLTTQEQEYLYENILYIDTPGLEDIEMHHRAATSIEKALKHNNNYKIVFVATLESGRIRPADLATINTVCGAIKTEFQYGIIFNKVTNAVDNEVKKRGLNQYLLKLKRPPYIAILLARDNTIEDKSGRYFQINSENRIKLLNFLNTLTANKIEKEDIEKINVRDYGKELNEIEEKNRKEIIELAEQTKKMEEQAREMKEKHRRELEELNRRAEEQKRQIRQREEQNRKKKWVVVPGDGGIQCHQQ